MTTNDMLLINELEDELLREDARMLVIYAGLNDEGEQYIDIEILTGHAPIDHNANKSISLADYIGADDLREAFTEIVKLLKDRS